PSRASDFFSCSSRASSSPTPTGRISAARSDSWPRGAYHSGLQCTTTRAPSPTTPATASNTCRQQVTPTELAYDRPRSARPPTPPHHVGDRVDPLPVAGHPHRDVVRRIPQRQEDHPRAGPPRQLGDLPLHPHRAQPVDPPADEPRHLPDRDGSFRRRVDSHA